MTGTVYVVHAVDTEGPLYEGLEALFQQLNENFEIDLTPTRLNVERLRKREIDLNGKEDAAAEFVRPSRIDTYNSSWTQIDAMHHVFMSDEWRANWLDSAGAPYIVSWFCMDHVGFHHNPRRRAMGFHEIFKYYENKLAEYGRKEDRIYWHYHPMSFSKDAHRMGYNYSFKDNIHNEILARRIIDYMWFPAANRPGGHIEAFDINCWLEQWIPFDLANQSMEENYTLDAEEVAGRVPGRAGDWRGATTDWEVYKPSLYDYRQSGDLRRWVGRCLNMNSRHSNLSEREIRKAFTRAKSGKDTLISYTNHDFRDMIRETESAVGMIQSVASEFTEVTFRWSNAVSAFRAALNMKKTNSPKFNIELSGNILRISLKEGKIWGVQPFLALKSYSGDYYHDNFIIDSSEHWTYVFDNDSLNLNQVQTIGFACNDIVGSTCIVKMDVVSKHIETKILNADDWF